MRPDVRIRELAAGDLEEVARACFPDDRFDDIVDRLRDELRAQEEGIGWTLVAEAVERRPPKREAGQPFPPVPPCRDRLRPANGPRPGVERAGDPSSICGTLCVECHGRTAWVHNVAVRPDRRGRGVAGRLLADAERRCRARGISAISLHVRRDNAQARRAYEKAGFRFVSADGMRGDQLRYRKDLREGEGMSDER